jgi:hypothetical protein
VAKTPQVFGTATTETVTGLTTGGVYTFTVSAINTNGTGLPSAMSNSITVGTPGAPTGVSGTQNLTNHSVISWTAPANGGSAITGYTATSSPGGFTCSTTGATTCNVIGLTNNTPYTFTVTATNNVGTGPTSAPSGTVTP